MKDEHQLPTSPAVAAMRKRAWAAPALVVIGVLSVLLSFAGGPTAGLFGVLYIAMGSLLIDLRRRRIRGAEATWLLQHAAVALDAGDPARALAVLKSLPKRSWSYLDGAALATRARVALANGGVTEARKLLDEAVAIQPGLLDRVEHAQQLTTSRALRALVAAGQGERELAMAEAEALAASDAATPDALRVAAMARALVLEREGRTEDLAELLRANGELLRRTSAPAERQLLHAWRRLIDAPKRAVYRKAHAFEEPLANPLETLPSGASDGEAERPSHERLSGTAERAAAEVRRGDGGSILRLGWRWALVAAVFAAIGFGFVTAGSRAGDPEASGPSPLLLVIPFAVVLFGAAFYAIQQTRKHARRLVAALRAMSRGERDEARRVASSMTTGPAGIPPQAELILASLALDEGDAAGALEHARRGLGHLRFEQVRLALFDTAYAPLVGLEALALAALDRTKEAEQALASIPDVPHAPRLRFAVRTMLALRAADEHALERLARDVPPGLSPRFQLLALLVRAVHHPGGIGALERRWLREDVRQAADRAFLVRLAPALLERFEEEAEPLGDTTAITDDAAAEREASAEAEAHASLAFVSRR